MRKVIRGTPLTMMADIVDLPTRGIPDPIHPREMHDQPEPTDLMVWALCPYMDSRNLQRCMGCPKWEDWGSRGKATRGCRALAEEACKIVLAAQARGVTATTP